MEFDCIGFLITAISSTYCTWHNFSLIEINFAHVLCEFDPRHEIISTAILSLPLVVSYWRKDVGWLVVLRLNVPVNNFSVMSGRSHRFLGN